MGIRIILNGKKAGLESVRQAVFAARQSGNVDVRVTWEAGDAERLVNEAITEGCGRIVAGGGDGSVNEIVNALMYVPLQDRPELAILPLGTANDFATACGIPTAISEAIALAQTATAVDVDCARANEHYFINVASGGFGALVTTNTPVALKNFLGGGAYTLAGLVQALSFVPREFHHLALFSVVQSGARVTQGGGTRTAANRTSPQSFNNGSESAFSIHLTSGSPPRAAASWSIAASFTGEIDGGKSP